MLSDGMEIPGQSTIDEVTPEPAPAAPESHHFRIVHERSNEGATFPHSVSTSEPHTWEDALTHFLALGALIGKDVPAILAAL
jgi:hypothetical protein